MYTLEEIAALRKKLYKVLLISILFISVGCTTQQPTVVTPDIMHTKPVIQPSVVTENKNVVLAKVDWSKYSEYWLFTLYLILLVTACIYFKHTGKRSEELETSLRTMSPRLSPITKLLSYLAKVLGILYCRKK